MLKKLLGRKVDKLAVFNFQSGKFLSYVWILGEISIGNLGQRQNKSDLAKNRTKIRRQMTEKRRKVTMSHFREFFLQRAAIVYVAKWPFRPTSILSATPKGMH